MRVFHLYYVHTYSREVTAAIFVPDKFYIDTRRTTYNSFISSRIHVELIRAMYIMFIYKYMYINIYIYSSQ